MASLANWQDGKSIDDQIAKPQTGPRPRREGAGEALGGELLCIDIAPQECVVPSKRLPVLPLRRGELTRAKAHKREIIASAEPCPAKSETQNAASPASATRPRDQFGILIWLSPVEINLVRRVQFGENSLHSQPP